MNEQEELFHTHTVQYFRKQLYKGVLTKRNITSKEVMKKYNNNTYYGYVLELDDKQYFLRSENIEDLPIKVSKTLKFDYQGIVYLMIIGYNSIKIPTEAKMSFRELVEKICPFTHSQPDDWTLYKIICLASWIDRLVIRISTKASFGKDSIINALRALVNNTAKIQNATLAKLKYNLKNDFIVINEVGGLSKPDRDDLQSFLLQAADYGDLFENPSRSTKGTKEIYDISDMSLMVLHNIKSYYTDKGMDTFEDLFTAAVVNRLPCLELDGYLTTDFTKRPDAEQCILEQGQLLKDIISTLGHLKQNKPIRAKFIYNDWGLDKSEKRAERSFNVLSQWIGEYALDQSEFDKYCGLVKQAYTRYKQGDFITINNEEVV